MYLVHVSISVRSASLYFSLSNLLTMVTHIFASQRPAFVMGRSLLLLGLMYSNEKLSENQSKSKQKRQQGDKAKKGYLYVHVHQAKRLPMRNVGMTPDPQIKWYVCFFLKNCNSAIWKLCYYSCWLYLCHFNNLLPEWLSSLLHHCEGFVSPCPFYDC